LGRLGGGFWMGVFLGEFWVVVGYGVAEDIFTIIRIL
jgi:hypothetical protein